MRIGINTVHAEVCDDYPYCEPELEWGIPIRAEHSLCAGHQEQLEARLQWERWEPRRTRDEIVSDDEEESTPMLCLVCGVVFWMDHQGRIVQSPFED